MHYLLNFNCVFCLAVFFCRALLETAPGVRVVDCSQQHQYPMPITATQSFEVEVGRVRESLVFAPCGLDLFVSGDQLLRGAALNAVLIAERIVLQKQQQQQQEAHS